MLGEAGACKGIAKVMDTHTEDTQLSKRVCDAVRYMCAVEENKNLFGENGMCELLTTDMQKYYGSHQCSSFLCRAIGMNIILTTHCFYTIGVGNLYRVS